MSDERLDLAVQLRHALHAHPELSGREFWTRQTLMDFLRAHTRLEVVDRGSWFYAFCKGRGAGKVAFRADFDALPMEETLQIPHRSCCPGAAHKCGHDGHSAALALLGLTLDKEGAARDTYLIFQPAEEIGGGGEACAAFLREEIPFGAIARLVEGALEALPGLPATTLEEIFAADQAARRAVDAQLRRMKGAI